MATNTLTDQNISDTYVGLLHGQGEQLPITGQVLMYDGNGNSTSIRVGRLGQGFSVIGTLSSDVLSVAGITYPTADGSVNSYMKTDGAGTLSFGSIGINDLPTLSPNPASTYINISSITIDAKGRVTNVKESGGGASYSLVSLFATPIILVDTVLREYSSTVNVYRSNMPAGTTHVLLHVDMAACSTPNDRVRSDKCAVYINNDEVCAIGSDVWMVGETLEDHYTNNNTTHWYAQIDTSNNISVRITPATNNMRTRTRVKLLGYATFNTLSNP